MTNARQDPAVSNTLTYAGRRSRRARIAASTVGAVLASLVWAAPAGADEVIDTVDVEVLASGNPFVYDLAFAPDGSFAYILDQRARSLSVVDTSTREVTDVILFGTPPGDESGLPFAVAFAPNGTVAYVSQPNVNAVSVIDTDTHTVVDTIPVGAVPRGVAVTPDGAHLYVANSSSGTLSVIDTDSHESTVINLGEGVSPTFLKFSPDGTRAYVTAVGALLVINVTTSELMDTIALGTNHVTGIAFTPDGTRAYVTQSASNIVHVINVATNSLLTSISVEGGPFGIAITPDGTRAYVTLRFQRGVSVIDTATNTLSPIALPAGLAPFRMAISPNGALLYVTNSAENTMTVIALDSMPQLEPATLDSGSAGEDYSATVVFTGSPAPTVAVTTGNLPPGLVLDADTGEITGTPTAGGTYRFTITASSTVSGISATDSEEYSITLAWTDLFPSPPPIPPPSTDLDAGADSNADASSSELPDTGADITALTLGTLALLVTGAGLVMIGRRRLASLIH